MEKKLPYLLEKSRFVTPTKCVDVSVLANQQTEITFAIVMQVLLLILYACIVSSVGI